MPDYTNAKAMSRVMTVEVVIDITSGDTTPDAHEIEYALDQFRGIGKVEVLRDMHCQETFEEACKVLDRRKKNFT